MHYSEIFCHNLHPLGLRHILLYLFIFQGDREMISSKTTMQLKFDMQVLASTCIKRKKPWSQLAIIGEVCVFIFFQTFLPKNIIQSDK